VVKRGRNHRIARRDSWRAGCGANPHVRFGERAGETDQPKGWHRAPVRLHKTVTVEHVAGLPVRNPATVAFAAHYGLTVATCLPADPQSKGGSEATVRVAKADLVPMEANLREDYGSLSELETACAGFGEQVDTRPHRVTRRPPVEMLAEEQTRLHRLPDRPYTAAFGVTRRVEQDTPMVSFDGGRYSVPHRLAGDSVWVRRHGEQIVIVACGVGGPVEVARHQATTPGNPRVADEHFPPAPAGPLHRTPRARTAAEQAFLRADRTTARTSSLSVSSPAASTTPAQPGPVHARRLISNGRNVTERSCSHG
jgi:Mu transposase, C-terminal domain